MVKKNSITGCIFSRLDGESFSDELEPYRLNPALEMNSMNPDEQRTYELLDKLGITRDILICTNLEKTFNTPVNGRYKHFTVENNGAQLNSNVNMNPVPIITKDLTQFLKLNITNDFVSKIRALNVDIKQSINGTYRIIYHSMQKELRKETSEPSKNNNKNNNQGEHNSRHEASNGNKTQHIAVKPLSSHNTKKFHSSEKVRGGEHDFSNAKITRLGTSRTKLSDTYDLNRSNKSIFVKLNKESGSGQQQAKNPTILHKSFQASSPQEAAKMSGHSMYTKSSSQRFSSIPTHEHLYSHR
jgi:hypothetical protein